jgi:hypothetical protein
MNAQQTFAYTTKMEVESAISIIEIGHFTNAAPAIEITKAGIQIEPSEVQPSNRFDSIFTTRRHA